MFENKNNLVNPIRKERFEFKLMVNDNIICQRYFKINNLVERSLISFEFKELMDYCVSIIDDDLKSKSRIYMWYSAPLIFHSKNEMDNWFSKSNYVSDLISGKFVFIIDENKEYWWDGEKLSENEKVNSDDEFITPIDYDKSVYLFKFIFIDNGKDLESPKVLYTKIWDGNVYPRFVRNSVDLSNKKGKFDNYETNKNYSESSIIGHMTTNKSDLVSLIIREICDGCTVTTKDYYNIKDNYGETIYDSSREKSWSNYVNKLSNIYKKKTEEYFNNI